TADNARGRRDQLAQRRVAAVARFVRLPAPDSILHRSPLTRETSGKGQHGDLPGKHGRHLRRHRVRRGHGWIKQDLRLSPKGISEGVREDSLRHKGKGSGFLEASRRTGKG